ncbi:NAD(P)-binding protein [Xylariaceae sp. FL0662B]|nr:NAD(P)-binding protein [Xylariaceae sp. FL0662B]
MTNSTVVFVTGVGKGIGRAIAQIYLSRPNHIVIGSVRDEATQEVSELKSSQKGSDAKLLIVHIESTSIEDPKIALREIEAAGIDHIDVIIANAGGYPPVVPLDAVDRKDLMSCFEVNAAAPLLLFQTFGTLLRNAKSPKWVVISTTGGSIGYIGVIGSHIVPAYGASKAALNWFNQSIHFSQEWLTVVTLHPGLVQTPQGNWVAQQVGLDQAPTTVEESSTSIVKVIDDATRESTSGKFISAIEGTELPW